MLRKRTNDDAKLIIESMKTLQERGVVMPCPRCGRNTMNSKLVMNALSRYADVYVCDECGTDEALRDYCGEPWQLNEWSLAISF